MQVRKFEAKSMQEALQMIKQELGPEAVILGAKDNSSSFGLGGRSSIEVTAAISDLSLKRKFAAEKRMNKDRLAQFRASPARSQKEFINKVFDKPVVEKRQMTQTRYIDIDFAEAPEVQKHQALAKDVIQNIQGRSVAEVLRVENRRTLEDQRAEAQRVAQERERASQKENTTIGRTESLENILADRQPRREESSSEYQNEVKMLRQQIKDLEKVISGFQSVPQTFINHHPGAAEGITFELSFMYEKLTQAGISVENTVEILKQCKDQLPPPQMKKKSFVDAWVARYILDTTRIIPGANKDKFQVFVGPSGQGKTSSLVKFASQLVLMQRKRVAIITTDTSRVGAVEQLRIYSQILNIPFAVVKGGSEWEKVQEKLGHFDHILVDTPGFQLKNPEEVAKMSHLLPPIQGGRSVHYVQSVLAKDTDAFEVAKRYRRFAFQDVIFTNLDETHQHGIIYNFQKYFSVSLHSFGIGSSIPEDFEMASKERVVDLLFKLTKLRKERG